MSSEIPDFYYGDIVDSYEAERVDDPVWVREQSVVQRFASSLERGTHILDAPIGTGRFLKYYL